MIDRFLLFMKMFLTGVFKFTVGAVGYLVVIIGAVIVAVVIARVKILSIIFLIILGGITAFSLFLIAGVFWSRYKKERDSRGL